jgi:hypothetical protein
LIGALLLALAPALQDLGTTTTLSMPPLGEPENARLIDFDADGRRDLVVALSRVEGQHRYRYVRVYLRRKSGSAFATEPDHEVRLTADVTAVAVADLHADPGCELLLCNGKGAFVWRALAEEGPTRVVRVAELDFLWQVGGVVSVIDWQAGVRDLNADGLDDLFLPVLGGYQALFQARDEQGAVSFTQSALTLPIDPSMDQSSVSTGTLGGRTASGHGVDASEEQVEILLGLESPISSPRPLISVTDTLPSPHLVDWDGDGDIDVIAQSSEELYVWTQTVGAYPAAPDVRRELPVKKDASRVLDISYSAHARQLDGDGRVDCVVFAGDRNSRDVRTQILIYHQQDELLFGEKGLPQQLIVLAGFAGSPRLSDFNQDGRPDLVVGAMRPDLIDTLRSASTKRLDIELHVFENLGGTFSKRPVMTADLSVPLESGRFTARFFGDVTGDGISDLLLRDDKVKLKVLMVRKTRDGMQLVERPLWEIPVESRATLLIAEGTPERAPELLILEETQVVHVSFP